MSKNFLDLADKKMIIREAAIVVGLVVIIFAGGGLLVASKSVSENTKYFLQVGYYECTITMFMVCISIYFARNCLILLCEKERAATQLMGVLGFVIWSFVLFRAATIVPHLYNGSAIFKENEVTIHSLIQDKSYKYSDIEKIMEVKKAKSLIGTDVSSPYFVLVFNDGSRWSNRNASGSFSFVPLFPYRGVIVNFILRKTGKRLQKTNWEE